VRTRASAVRDVVARATATLAQAGVSSPEHDAWALLEHASGRSRAALVALDAEQASEIPGIEAFHQDLVPRRAAREPLQHLTGRAAFRFLELSVGPGVFVPRPETEAVAGVAVDEARRRAAPVVVDLCTGSGAVALAVAFEVPTARVHAVDVDPAALSWAALNVAALGLSERVELHAADVADLLPAGGAAGALAGLAGRVEVVVANPPYVPDADGAGMDQEVRDHDPAPALFGGPDGLAVVRTVVAVAAFLLRPGGLLVCEHDARHASAVRALAGAGWLDVTTGRDLSGRDRYVRAWRAGAVA
jgi:release factor glutamine methyltransferase